MNFAAALDKCRGGSRAGGEASQWAWAAAPLQQWDEWVAAWIRNQ